MKKFLLFETDGYSISVDEFTTKEEANNEMKKRFNNRVPAGWDDDWCENPSASEQEMSYISENDAIMYADGCDVYVWRIYAA